MGSQVWKHNISLQRTAARTCLAGNWLPRLASANRQGQRIWSQARVKPHRLTRYIASDDPQFEEEKAEIIALYMDPPQHAAVAEFLDRKARVRFHFTPTYSSWLNQVEIWFAKIQRDVIDRGVFSSVTDLSRKLLKYIRSCKSDWWARFPSLRAHVTSTAN